VTYYDEHEIEVKEDGIWQFKERQADGSLRTFLTVTITEIVAQLPDEQASCDVHIRAFNAPTKEQTVEDAHLRVYFTGD
jgi:hypothetical protein